MERRLLIGKHTATRFVLAAAAALTMATTLWAQASFKSWPIHQAPPEYRALISRGDLIVVSLQDAVLRELQDALSKSGAEGAIAFCHLDATFTAQRLARHDGIAAGRTSDRLRNPTNAPRPWAADLVRAHAGERARSVDGFVVDLGDKVGLLRPISHRPMCNGCHGPVEGVSAGVKAVLADRYPVDRAIGFTEGEIRGWFWVEVAKSPR
jgi:Protein of unknown function (DUF3365)